MLLTRISLLVICMTLTACGKEEPQWSSQQLNVIASLSLAKLETAPASPSNRFADDERAALLGKQIFFDKRFSQGNKLSCASCHQPEAAFTDGLAKAKGIRTTGRNTQGLLGAAHQTWFYWDGRKDSLWAQALVPFEAADEMASNRVQVMRIIGNDHDLLRKYETIFGKFPRSVFDQNIPENAGPWGDVTTRDNWFRIPFPIQKKINAAYANVGKAIAAYERTIPIPETRFDKYADAIVNGNSKQAGGIFSDEEVAGLKLFINQDKTHCLRCHNGPLFSNSGFHNIGSGNFTGPQLDFGRYLGIQAVLQDEFNCLGNFSDSEPEDCHALRFLRTDVHDDMQGAYKTPGLRYLNKTAPYFHDGRHSTTAEVLDHYVKNPSNSPELPELILTEEEKQQLLAFLETLSLQ